MTNPSLMLLLVCSPSDAALSEHGGGFYLPLVYFFSLNPAVKSRKVV